MDAYLEHNVATCPYLGIVTRLLPGTTKQGQGHLTTTTLTCQTQPNGPLTQHDVDPCNVPAVRVMLAS